MSRYRMNPGELRHIITIQSRSLVQNDYGEESDEWSDFQRTRAGIYPISGNEYYEAETINSEVSHKVKVRYIPGIEPEMRIKFGKRIFHLISAINFQERNIELQLLCKELL